MCMTLSADARRPRSQDPLILVKPKTTQSSALRVFNISCSRACFAVCFRYVPADDVASEISKAASSGPAGKGYFSGLRAAQANESDQKAADMPTRAEMSATVKAAARAAAARLAGGDKGKASAADGGRGGAAESGSSKRIERDIFAARPSRGQALGVEAGGYDVYPETGDFETYDSDEVPGDKFVSLMFRWHFPLRVGGSVRGYRLARPRYLLLANRFHSFCLKCTVEEILVL